MRKILLSFFVTLTTLTVQAQIVNIPDANFKNALLTHNPVIDLNADGQIQVSEAIAFTGFLRVDSKNIADLTGINAFTNITRLSCTGNQLTSLNIVGLNSLTHIYSDGNRFTTLSFNNLPALQGIFCPGNLLTALQLTNLPQLQTINAEYNYFTTLNFSGLPSLRLISIFMNRTLTDLVVDNLPNLKFLSCNQCNLANLTLNGLPLLDTLFCGDNKLTSITVPNPARLKVLAASQNLLTNVPAGVTNLIYLDVSSNKISNFLLDNMNALVFVYVSNNLCTSFSLTNKPSLKFVRCSNNLINNLQLSNLPFLTTLDCGGNQLTSLSLNGYTLLEELRCESNQIASLTLTNLPKLGLLYCAENRLATLSLSNLPTLGYLNCQSNQMTNLSLNNVPNVYEIDCDNNQLATLPFLTPAILPKLKNLSITGNRISQLSLDNFPFLYRLDASNNPIDSLRLKNLPVFEWMRIEKTRLTILKLDSLPQFHVLYCGKSDSLRNISLQVPVGHFFCDSTNLISIDLSQTRADRVEITNNPLLQYINMRNTVNSLNSIKFFHNDLLQFICADDAEKIRVIDSVLSQLPGQGILVSTVCNYIPAISSTIKGTVRFDLNANGCNNGASNMLNVRLNNYDGIYSTSAFSNSSGQYVFHTLANTDTVVTALQQPSWFNVSPPIHVINIPNPGVTVTADFCITANVVHPDLEISLIPLGWVRPGYDANYKLVYRNKGNQLQSGTVTLTFDNIKINFISAVPPVTSQGVGSLSWSYTGLSPYETRVINLVFHINAPPIVNTGDILSFVATVNPLAGDESPVDNIFYLNQIVVNSFDPNDKQVTEGSQISINKLGEYLHYVVRFQNTGTAEAIRVIIKDSLSANLDWNSFEPIIASHPYRAVITKGNLVEFIFDGINLPPKVVNEPASNGFVSFKIKPKSSLAIGDSIQNAASIFFDFNLPIVTNTVTTKIYKPGNDNVAGITVYSNPTKDYLSFSVNPGVEIKGINLFNSMGQKMNVKITESTSTNRKIDVSNFANGVYFLELTTNSGKLALKIMIVK